MARFVYLLEVRKPGSRRVVWRSCLVQRSPEAAKDAGQRMAATMPAGHVCKVFRCIVDGEVWSSS